MLATTLERGQYLDQKNAFWQASALRTIAEIERSSVLKRPSFSSIFFSEGNIRVTLCGEASFMLQDPTSLTECMKLFNKDAIGRYVDRDEPNSAFEWEQWHETLSDLAGYPSFFEDLPYRLVPNLVQRFSDCTIFSFRTFEKIFQYQYYFDAQNEFPLGLPDEIRYSTLTGNSPGPFLNFI